MYKTTRITGYIIIAFMLYALSNSFAEENVQDKYIKNYATLLSKYVTVGEKKGYQTYLVDYAAWGEDPLYQEVLRDLLQYNPDNLLGDAKIAFWINAYNFLTIDLIIKTSETKSIKNQGNLFENVWERFYWNIHGTEYSLDHIEHTILRSLGEPRIHMAINCASLSCPDLRSEPYTAQELERQLEEQTQLFINNPTKGVKVSGSHLKVSRIFKWFAEDFGGKIGVKEFVYRYLPHQNDKKITSYLEYSWDLNSTAF